MVFGANPLSNVDDSLPSSEPDALQQSWAVCSDNEKTNV